MEKLTIVIVARSKSIRDPLGRYLRSRGHIALLTETLRSEIVSAVPDLVFLDHTDKMPDDHEDAIVSALRASRIPMSISLGDFLQRLDAIDGAHHPASASDWRSMFTRIGGDAEMLREICDILLRTLPEVVRDLNKSSSDMMRFQCRAQTLKSCLQYWPSSNACRAATILESEAQDPLGIKTALQIAEIESEKLFTHIRDDMSDVVATLSAPPSERLGR